MRIRVAFLAALALVACDGRRVVGLQVRPDAGDGFDASTRREVCYDGVDGDDNGVIDDGCPCTPGERQPCWPGNLQRREVGACRDGVQTCAPFGDIEAFGSCEGAALPAAEIAANGIDEDCDGSDEGGRICDARETSCDDSFDDDCDGRTDCVDPDCAASPACSATCTDEIGALCDDGSDNDCDGDVDCLDADCDGASQCSGPPIPVPGCTPQFPFVVELLCGDSADNDCDGRPDCADSDCQRPGSCGCELMESACSDGMDGDCDGHVDCADLDCQECAPGSVRWCNDTNEDEWGLQSCGSGGRWGGCSAAFERPSGCSGFVYSASCCIEAGSCCENYPTDQGSVGACDGLVACVP